MLIELEEKDLEIIQELIDNVYPMLDRTNNELRFCISKGYLMHEHTDMDEQREMLGASVEKINMLDNLQQKLGFKNDIRPETTTEEPQIKIQ